MYVEIKDNGVLVLHTENPAEVALLNVVHGVNDTNPLTFELERGELTARGKRSVPGLPLGLTNADYQEVIDMLRQNSKLEAVKYVKERTGMGLKESKDWVDGVQENIRR